MNPAVLAALAAQSQVPRIARLSNRSIIYVTGSQAPSFLNGVLATSVTDVKPFYSVILNAQAGRFPVRYTPQLLTITLRDGFYTTYLPTRQQSAMAVAAF